MAIALVSSYPPGVLFALFLAYAGSGYVLYIWGWLRRRRQLTEAAVAPRQEDNSGD
jgi:CDP-diacylglycerol--serine O-phosphatidyltransferase